MARPTKSSFDYFSMDVVLDKKFRLFKAKYKLMGIGFIDCLFREIYSEGYYLKWDTETQLLFADEYAIDELMLTEMVVFAVNIGFFDAEIYEKYQILTSSGIQKRCAKASERRACIQFSEELLLIDPNHEDFKKVKIELIPTETELMLTETELMHEKTPQRKVKESKRKEKEIPPYSPPLENPIENIELPDFLDRETWVRWVRYLKKKDNPLLEESAHLQIRKLIQWHAQGHDTADIINRSIMNGYKGLTEPTKKQEANSWAK
jgi:hypothetical protein